MSRFSKTTKFNRKARRDNGGFVAVEFVVGLGVLVLPIAMLVISIPTWAEREELARSASREAARTYAITGDAGAAQSAADEVAANYGLPDGDVSVSLGDMPALPIVAGDTVDATVTVKIPALNLAIFKIATPEVDYSATHSEPLDIYRSRTVGE